MEARAVVRTLTSVLAFVTLAQVTGRRVAAQLPSPQPVAASSSDVDAPHGPTLGAAPYRGAVRERMRA